MVRLVEARLPGSRGSIGLMAVGAARDTPPEVFDVLVDRWRAMSPCERASLAGRLSNDVATLATAGIRAGNPGIGNVDLAHELARRRYGSALADAAYRRYTEA